MTQNINLWTNTKTTLPPFNRVVLVKLENGQKMLAKYTIDGRWYLVNYVKSFHEIKENLSFMLDNVVEWIYLPN